eukprot:3637725-Pyramimonas_sp.AAC.1
MTTTTKPPTPTTTVTTILTTKTTMTTTKTTKTTMMTKTTSTTTKTTKTRTKTTATLVFRQLGARKQPKSFLRSPQDAPWRLDRGPRLPEVSKTAQEAPKTAAK